MGRHGSVDHGKFRCSDMDLMKSFYRTVENNSSEKVSRNESLQRPWTGAGPGSYNVNHSYTIRSEPRVKFGSSPKFYDTADYSIPGPGTYNFKTLLGKGPRAIICSRKNPKLNLTLPGPSDYNTAPRNHSPSCRIGTSPRLKINLERSPGPADYMLKSLLSPSKRGSYFYFLVKSNKNWPSKKNRTLFNKIYTRAKRVYNKIKTRRRPKSYFDRKI